MKKFKSILSNVTNALLLICLIESAQVRAQLINPLASPEHSIQLATTLREVELKEDKFSSAVTIAKVQAGVKLKVIAVEGGWALVGMDAQVGWARASALVLPNFPSIASAINNGRTAANNTVG